MVRGRWTSGRQMRRDELFEVFLMEVDLAVLVRFRVERGPVFATLHGNTHSSW